MATRGRPKSDQKRVQILRAAADLFTTQGYSNTSLEQVAVAAEVSKQTIYSHFADKADVLRQAVKHRCEEGMLTMESLDFSLTPEAFIPMFAERFIALLTAEGALRMYRLCLNEGHRHPEVGEAFYEAGPKLVSDAMAAYLSEANARGELSVPEPEMAAVQLLFGLRGYPVDRVLLNAPDSAYPFSNDAYINSCCDSFLRAYAVDA